MADLGREEEELTGAGGSSGGSPRVSGNGQVDAAAFVEAEAKDDGRGRARGSARGRRRREEARGGKVKVTPWPYL